MFEASYPSIELSENHVIYEVTDPEAARDRVGLVNSKPVTMMVDAVKTANVPLFETPPLQSDYVATWAGENTDDKKKSLVSRIAAKLRYHPLTRGFIENRIFSFSNKKHYKKI